VRRTWIGILAGGLALALAAPGTAQAPTLEDRVRELEHEVLALRENVVTLAADNRFLEQRLELLESAAEYLDIDTRSHRIDIDHLRADAETRQAEVAQLRAAVEVGAKRDACMRNSVAFSMRRNRDVFVTRRDAQRKAYVPVVDRSCLAGVRDDYRFPGFRGSP
jgi:chromosome segregation ATPase